MNGVVSGGQGVMNVLEIVRGPKYYYGLLGWLRERSYSNKLDLLGTNSHNIT